MYLDMKDITVSTSFPASMSDSPSSALSSRSVATFSLSRLKATATRVPCSLHSPVGRDTVPLAVFSACESDLTVDTAQSRIW
jgi:hypothetical protein